MLREKEVLAILQVGRKTLQRWVAAKTFPAPVGLSARRIAWYADEVAAWQKTRPLRRVSSHDT